MTAPGAARLAGILALIPVDQARAVGAAVDFSSCPQHSSDADQASDCQPFDRTVGAKLACGSGWAPTTADQHSQIGSPPVTSSGGAFTRFNGGDPGIVTLSGESLFESTFQVPIAVQFTLQGTIAAGPVAPVPGLQADAELTLSGAEQTIWPHSVSSGTGGAIAESGALAPGVYTLGASATVGFDASVPPLAAGDALLRFTFTAAAACTLNQGP